VLRRKLIQHGPCERKHRQRLVTEWRTEPPDPCMPAPLRFTEIPCGSFMRSRIGLTKDFQGTIERSVSHGPMRLPGKDS